MSHPIAAVSTGNQVCAIGIIRLSGDGCIAVADRVFTLNNQKTLSGIPDRHLCLGQLHDKQRRVIDNCCVVVAHAPHSYTGEDTVEFHCHGSPAVLAAGLEALYLAGAKPAGRGEFTKRAFLNGKLDLTQAEAVIDLIEADTADAAANAAGQVGGVLQKKLAPIYDVLVNLCSHFHAVLDYPDEDIDDFSLKSYSETLRKQRELLERLLATCQRGSILKNGVKAVILGRPNAGKSSLLNALAGYERVIVTDIPGTTRDTVEEKLKLGGVLLRLSDTAGIRETEDTVERIGVRRALAAAEEAELALVVLDGSMPLTPEDRIVVEAGERAKNAICVISKADLPQRLDPGVLPFRHVVSVSSKTGDGLEELSRMVSGLYAMDVPCDGTMITSARHQGALTAARDAILRAEASMELGETPDAVLLDVEEALEAMGGLLGKTMREDITNDIFSRFCVGK